MLWIEGKYPASHVNGKLGHLKNCKKSAVKYSLEKHILLNFVSLSKIFSAVTDDVTNFKNNFNSQQIKTISARKTQNKTPPGFA